MNQREGKNTEKALVHPCGPVVKNSGRLPDNNFLCINARECFDRGDLLLESRALDQGGYPKFLRHAILFCPFANQLVYSVLFKIKPVKAPFIVDIKQDQYTTAQANRQPRDIYKGK